MGQDIRTYLNSLLSIPYHFQKYNGFRIVFSAFFMCFLVFFRTFVMLWLHFFRFSPLFVWWSKGNECIFHPTGNEIKCRIWMPASPDADWSVNPSHFSKICYFPPFYFYSPYIFFPMIKVCFYKCPFISAKSPAILLIAKKLFFLFFPLWWIKIPPASGDCPCLLSWLHPWFTI